MTKNELIDEVRRAHGLTVRQAGRIVTSVFNTIRDEVLRGSEVVSVRGFGTFTRRATRTSGKRKDGTFWSKPNGRAVAFTPYAASGGPNSKVRAKTVPAPVTGPKPLPTFKMVQPNAES